MPYGYVYITINKINNKKYIGQHKSEVFDEEYFGSGILIRRSIGKYGKESFVVHVLEWCDTKKSLDEREKYWIAKYNAVESEEFYNKAYGGYGMVSEAVSGGKNNHARAIRCVETGEVFECMKDAYMELNVASCSLKRALGDSRRKCAGFHWEYMDNRPYKYNTCNFNNINGFKGHKHTDEVKKRISEKAKGRPIEDLRKPVVAVFSKKRYSHIGEANRDGIIYSYDRGMSLTLKTVYRGDFWIYEEDFLNCDDKEYFARNIMGHFATLISNKKIEYDKNDDERWEKRRLKCYGAGLRLSKLSKSYSHAGKNNPMYGKHHSEETKQKIREKNRLNQKPSSRYRKVIDIESGEVFESLSDAGRSINRCPSTLCTMIKYGRRCNGRLFEYYDNYLRDGGKTLCR